MLGLGAVDGGEDWELVCDCEGGSCRKFREVEKGRIDDIDPTAQPFRRAGKCEAGPVEMVREELRCDVNLHRACCFMVCRQRCARGAASILKASSASRANWNDNLGCKRLVGGK
jgi:hypothetical protein